MLMCIIRVFLLGVMLFLMFTTNFVLFWFFFFFFSSRRRHTRFDCDWSSDVCSSDLNSLPFGKTAPRRVSYGGPVPSCLVGRQRPGSSELSSLLCPSVSVHPRRASPEIGRAHV